MSDIQLKPGPGTLRQPVAVQAIIVLYKQRPDDSSSVRTLLESADFARGSAIDLRICIADNTPGGQGVDALPPGVDYQTYPDNPGLAPIYNRAIDTSERDGLEWLLTLDQDTHLPLNFLASMAECIQHHRSDQRVAAIVPRIVDGMTPISPFRFVRGILPRVTGQYESGILGPHASALNSASMLRVSALKEVGGYDERFPLNNSDTALFERLDRANFRIALAGDVMVHHELAIMQRQQRMTIERYRQLLKDERDFWDLRMNFMARTERLVRLAGRSAKAWFHHEDPDFQQATLRELRHRLLTRRSKRMKTPLAS